MPMLPALSPSLSSASSSVSSVFSSESESDMGLIVLSSDDDDDEDMNGISEVLFLKENSNDADKDMFDFFIDAFAVDFE